MAPLKQHRSDNLMRRTLQPRKSPGFCSVKLMVLGCLFGTPHFAGLLAFAAPPTSSQAKTDEVPQRLEEARALQAKGSSREARNIYESLVPVLRTEQRNPELAAVLTALGEIAPAQGEYDVAIARASEAAAIYHNLGDQRGEARALNNWGAAELYRGDYPAALARLQRALALSVSAGDREVEVEQLSNIGHAFYYQGKYMDAWRAYQRAMDVLDHAGNSPSVARNRQLAISDMATLLQRLGRDERALELYQQLRNSPLAVRPTEQARLLANLGVLYRHLGDPVKALQTYRQAQDLYAREQHAQGQIGVLRNIGIVLALDLGDLSGAIQAFSRALKLAEETNDRLLATHAHLYRGESLFLLNQLDAASRDFEAALATSKEDRASAPEERCARAVRFDGTKPRARISGQTSRGNPGRLLDARVAPDAGCGAIPVGRVHRASRTLGDIATRCRGLGFTRRVWDSSEASFRRRSAPNFIFPEQYFGRLRGGLEKRIPGAG